MTPRFIISTIVLIAFLVAIVWVMLIYASLGRVAQGLYVEGYNCTVGGKPLIGLLAASPGALGSLGSIRSNATAYLLGRYNSSIQGTYLYNGTFCPKTPFLPLSSGAGQPRSGSHPQRWPGLG